MKWRDILFVFFMFILLEMFVMYKSAQASVTFVQAKQVFARIQNQAGVHAVLRLDKTSEINAYATAYGVYINQGMLDFCDNESQSALVLGHELSHFNNGDARHEESFETRADREGYYYIKKLGYKNGISFMKKALKVFGDEGDEMHPKWSQRIRDLKYK